MAEKHEDMKGEKPKEAATPSNSHSVPAMIAQSLMNIVVQDGARFIYDKVKEAGDAKIEDRASRVRNKHYFADAMVKLRARDPYAADVIQDFFTYYLDNDTDREDFQHNSAMVGTDKDEKMGDTVQFLFDLAQLPSHEHREALLTALGFMGARSMDMYDRAQEILNTVKTMGKQTLAWIERDIANATARLDANTQELRARLEQKKKQQAAVIAARRTNSISSRIRNAWNALCGR